MSETDNSTLWVEHLIDLLQAFRRHNPDATLNQAITFLAVARHSGKITQTELLERYLDMKTSGQSRIISLLGKYGDRGTPGWGVIEATENPDDRRQKLLMLTIKGKDLLKKLWRDVEKMKRIA